MQRRIKMKSLSVNCELSDSNRKEGMRCRSLDCENCNRYFTEKKAKDHIGDYILKKEDCMALKSLNGVKELGGFDIVVMDDLREKFPEKFNESGAMDWQWFESEIRPKNFVYVRHDKNSLSFTIQNGPIKENGVNGCQVDTVIEAAKAIIEGLNKNFPCRENAMVITKLDEALMWLNKRKQDRISRGVEGENKL